MTRIKRGYIARRRRTKIRLFASSFRGAHSRLTRTINQQKIRALVSAHQDRGKQKRYFRRLWITRLNAVIRDYKVYYSYSRFIHNLYKKQLLLNHLKRRKLNGIHWNVLNGVPWRMNSGKVE
ncbi:hypothetical protein F8388_019179 [Cannabis sativa]|uniref:Large ribosomal subunit protein bL20c n=1 Tax=Cannabis sativa TaxID=3483 RepID=A0A7J6DR45_CANSA|nr:hypothetical protein F8388_000242 [Cannabis sativa]KAF4365935.1 hypothetical protein F8388_019179 [Cannabis sativa]